MASIPSEFHGLFETKTFAHLGTLWPNGAPHVTPVWIGYDVEADRLQVNTEIDRQKERNARNDPRVGVSMVDPADPYRWLSVTGEVEEFVTEGAREHIDELSRRYTGGEYQFPIQTERVILSIRPEHVVTSGE